VELLEQPGPKDDVAALMTLSRTASVPVIADESVATVDDVVRLADAGVTGVNLKLVKHGGPVMTGRLLRTAQRHSLALMAGAMVETRVGLSAMLAVVAASVTGTVGTPMAIDLDTAFLLTEDPFVGGYDAVGPRLRFRLDGPRRRTTPTRSKPRGPR
jgi:L-alanine-DL-glutamate epimerase-like enolase superfamily enzyme